MSENIQAPPKYSDPPEGTLVETTDTLLASTAGGIRAYKTLGRRPAGSVNAVEQEGDREKSPLWDGPSDERGPIPVFGPARTDESGRVLTNDEERAARRDAAIRALAAIGEITDETDTDERWDDVSRGLKGTS